MKTLLIIAMLALPCMAQAQDISGVYRGEGGTITIKKADNLRVVHLKPGFQAWPEDDYLITPDRLSGLDKKFTDTGRMAQDAYLVSFDMGKNKACPLTWKNLPGQFRANFLTYKDANILTDKKFFSLWVQGDELELDMPMNWVRDHGRKCESVERFYKEE